MNDPLCQTVTSNGSVCNLPESLHDGRELDSKGYLHGFNQPINPEREKEFNKFEDDDSASINSDITELFSIMIDASKFINNQIIRMSQNGTKFPPGFVDTACRISTRMSKFIEQDEDDSQVQPVKSKTISPEQRRLQTLRAKYPSKLRR